jgi:hypothetical protein
MQLQNLINGSWNTLESWTSKIGDAKHVFVKYGGSTNNISILLNGSSIAEDVLLGSLSNPTVINPSVDPLTNSTNFGLKKANSVSFINVSNTANGCCGAFGTQTISIPSRFSLPTIVNITGGVDDDLMVNGQIINGDNLAANDVNYTFMCDTRTFTVGGWNAQGPGAYGYTITFDSGAGGSIRVSVDPKTGWQDSGVNLSQDQKFEIIATGSVSWTWDSYSGPNGISHSPNRSDDRFQHEAILGRIGDSGEVFLVGAAFSGNANADGKLYLMTNDEQRSDNGGSFTAIIKTNFNTDVVDSPDLLKKDTSNILTIRRPSLAATAKNGGLI